MTSTEQDTQVRRDRTPLAAGLDTAVVVLFVAIGRRNHDEDPGVAGLVMTAAPFLIALAISWVVIRAWNRPAATTTGVQLWLGTVVIGMVLRRLVFDDGIALPFVIVASAFLGLFLIGWRLVVSIVDRRHAPV
jgi:hypothetical protein